MSNLRFTSGFALATAMALNLAGCGGGTQSAPQIRETPDRTVTLAFLIPQTSGRKSAAQLSAALIHAARMGLSDLNDNRIGLEIYDTAGDPAAAARAAQQAVADGADIILGPLFGSATRAVATVAQEAGLSVLSLSNDVGVAGGRVWVTGFLPETEAARIFGFARSQSYADIGVFYPKTSYGEAVMRGVRAAGANGPTRVVAATAFTPGFQTVQSAAKAFAADAAEADAILLAAGGTDLKSAASFMNYHDFDPVLVKYLGLGLWYSEDTSKETALRGGWFPAPDPDAVRAFSDRYATVYGKPPPLLAVLGYDVVRIAGRAIADSQRDGDSPFSVRALTRPAGFRGAFGAIRLTPDGRNERALAILEVGAAGFEIVDPVPESFAAGL